MKRLLLFAVVATLFAAYSKDTIEELQNSKPIVNEVPETITVGFEDEATGKGVITFDGNVTKIGKEAFYNCESLASVYCKATTPPTLGSSVFDYNASDRKIYVPASDDDSIINEYKSGWSEYASSIYEYDFVNNTPIL